MGKYGKWGGRQKPRTCGNIWGILAPSISQELVPIGARPPSLPPRGGVHPGPRARGARPRLAAPGGGGA
eukprot:8209765-Pyramimonas_sp.AAC.1